tara:strand:+ start:405 stop:578 length:174 start_codon:yes stop_codon:yes gene_type:complete
MEHGMDMIREISTSNTRSGMGDVVCREQVRHTVARDAPLFSEAWLHCSKTMKQGTPS